jgi:hypothetical protein
MTENTVLRIRTNPSSNLGVIQDSTPIVFFGNIEKSNVATLGLNPSKREFLSQDDSLLDGSEKRVETLKSLGVSKLSNLTDIQVRRVYDACMSYFRKEQGGNPYTRWFDQLDNHMLKKLGVSYYSDTACHLDIVQWATQPIWRHLDKETQQKLIQNDIKYLENQLFEYEIRTLLINGNGVHNEFCKYFKPKVLKQEKIVLNTTGVTETCEVYQLELVLHGRMITAYAWSKNLQSTYGMTNNMKQAISNWIVLQFQGK